MMQPGWYSGPTIGSTDCSVGTLVVQLVGFVALCPRCTRHAYMLDVALYALRLSGHVYFIA
jgi:hypothetical protein